MGTLFTVSAPSGAGKTSLVTQLLQSVNNIRLSISYTTRRQRKGEEEGKNYFFIDKQQFGKMQTEDLFLENAKVYGNFYGTSRGFVQKALGLGDNLILEINWEGAQIIKKKMPEAVGIFILPPSIDDLKSRLQKRGLDSEDIIEKRVTSALQELKHLKSSDYIVLNDDFDTALKHLIAIVTAESLKTKHACNHPVLAPKINQFI